MVLYTLLHDDIAFESYNAKLLWKSSEPKFLACGDASPARHSQTVHFFLIISLEVSLSYNSSFWDIHFSQLHLRENAAIFSSYTVSP